MSARRGLAAEPAQAMLPFALDLPLEELLQRCREVVEDPDLPTVREWRRQGGRVLAHFQVYFPEELGHAAGMLPVKLRGGQVERRDADSRFGSAICSIPRTALEMALNGTLVPDLFVTHPICDAARNLAGIWARNVETPAHILYLPQNPNSRHAVEYLTAEYRRILDVIEDAAGRPVSGADLAASIVVFNENRRLLRELYAIRRDTPWLLPVDDAYVLMALAGLIPREEHSALLRAALPAIRRRDVRKQDKMRVVFEGGFCEQPPLDLLGAIAEFAYVVDDDLLIGLRWLVGDVQPDGEALRNLAEAYIENSSYSPVQHDLRKPKEKMLLERIRNADAAAAIVAAAKMCEPGLDEQVAYAEALDAAGIPYFITEFEEKMTGFEHVQVQLETFVENLLFE